jgi:hypothetical protein
MTEQHDELQCEVDRLEYNFVKRIGRLYMADGDRCDMSACVQMFMAIDRHVKRIETFSGAEQDTMYGPSGPRGEWVSYRPSEWVLEVA